jgi:hypothetical protein
MKRFLNKVRRFEVLEVTGAPYRYELNDINIPEENELFIGETTGTEKGLFVYKTVDSQGQIFSVSHDDFSYNFLQDENARLNDAYTALTANITALANIPTMPDEDGGN